MQIDNHTPHRRDMIDYSRAGEQPANIRDLRREDDIWSHRDGLNSGDMIRRDSMDRSDIMGGIKKNQYG